MKGLNNMKYRVLIVKSYSTEIEAENEFDAMNKADELTDAINEGTTEILFEDCVVHEVNRV